MISRISGTIIECLDGFVVEVGGIGYEIQIARTLQSKTLPGTTVQLWTRMIVREDSQELYGFETQTERSVFDALIRVSGVGPKSALQILDSADFGTLVHAIRARNTELLTSIPGIGKKTAEKICLELADKLEHIAVSGSTNPDTELFDSLKTLGYSERRITEVLKNIPNDLPFEERLRIALRSMTTV